MGNKYSRKRDAPLNGAETAAPEEKVAEEPVATQPGEDSGTSQTHDADGKEELVVVMGSASPVAALPAEECVSECKVLRAPDISAPLSDAESEPVAKETPTAGEPSPSEPVPEPNPTAEAQVAPDPEPDSEPEDGIEPESNSETVPAPAEAPEQQTGMPTQESLPYPVICSTTLDDQDDATLDPDHYPAAVNPDEPSDITVIDECKDRSEVSIISTPHPPKSEEISESPEEVGAAGSLEHAPSDVNKEIVVQNLEPTENDPVADLISTGAMIPDDIPTTDMSTWIDFNQEKYVDFFHPMFCSYFAWPYKGRYFFQHDAKSQMMIPF